MMLHPARTLRAIVGGTLLFVAVATPTFRPAALHASGALYTLTDVGALNCCYDWVYASAALAINAHGDVAGFTSSPTDPSRTIPFVYQHGTMTAISDNYGWATSINDAGQIAGTCYIDGPAGVTIRACPLTPIAPNP